MSIPPPPPPPPPANFYFHPTYRKLHDDEAVFHLDRNQNVSKLCTGTNYSNGDNNSNELNPNQNEGTNILNNKLGSFPPLRPASSSSSTFSSSTSSSLHHQSYNATESTGNSNQNGHLLISLPQLDTPRPKNKMKSLNWSKIPVQKVVESCTKKDSTGLGNNLWAIMASSTSGAGGTGGPTKVKVDFELLEDLFCQPTPKSAPNSKPGSPMVQRKGGGLGRNDNHNLLTAGLRDLISKGFGTGSRKGFPSSEYSSTGSSGGSSYTEINLLDGKKSLNINIFLKQFRSSPDDLVSMIIDGDHVYFGAEGLNSLIKLLPTDDEVNLLKNNSSNYYRLAVAEKFLFQIIHISNYKLRIECMLLKEEYESNVSYLEPSIDVIKSAAREIQESQSLREVLYLVLVAGNFLNSGGYAGDAAGFKMMSLLKLAEIRANKPGISFIHFVAQQTEQNYLSHLEDLNKNVPTSSTDLPLFRELTSLEEASKITVDSLKMEINQLASRISRIKSQLKERSKGSDSENKFFKKMTKFISECDHEVTKIEKNIKKEIESIRIELASFLCEDLNEFKFEECFKIFNSFLQQFKNAMDENRRRRENELKQEAKKQQHRLSIVSSNSSASGGKGADQESSVNNKALLRPQSLELSGELDSTLFEFLTSTSHDGSSEGNLFGSTLRRSGRRSGQRPRQWRPTQENVDSRERSTVTTTATNDGASKTVSSGSNDGSKNTVITTNGGARSSVTTTNGGSSNTVITTNGGVRSATTKTDSDARSTVTTTNGTVRSTVTKVDDGARSTVTKVDDGARSRATTTYGDARSRATTTPGGARSTLITTNGGTRGSVTKIDGASRSTFTTTNGGTRSTVTTTNGGPRCRVTRTSGATRTTVTTPNSGARSTVSTSNGGARSTVSTSNGGARSTVTTSNGGLRNTISRSDGGVRSTVTRTDVGGRSTATTTNGGSRSTITTTYGGARKGSQPKMDTLYKHPPVVTRRNSEVPTGIRKKWIP